jgi:RND family efflux transporter MFP subunit
MSDQKMPPPQEPFDQSASAHNPAQDMDPGTAPADSGINFARIFFNVIAVAAILFVGIMGMKAMIAMRKPPPKQPLPPEVLKVQAMTVSVGSHTVSISANGTVTAKNQIKIIPEVTGKVLFAHPEFRDGGVIRKGEVLYRIDPADLQKQKNNSLANTSALHVEIDYLRDRKRTLNNELDQALKTLAIAEEEAARRERLFARGAAAEAEVNQSRLSVQSSRERIEAYRSNIALIDPSIDKIKAQLDVVDAGLGAVNLHLGRTEYKAPFDGVIVSGALEPGQFVAAGQPLAVLQDISVYEIPVPLPLSDWKALAPNRTAKSLSYDPMPVRVNWEDTDKTQHSCTGDVVRMGSQLDPRNRMVDLVVEVSPDARHECDMPLMAGMFTDVEFTGQNLDGVAPIPRRALREGNKVYVVEDGRFAVRDVVPWRSIGEEVFIEQGLRTGDVVITSVVEEVIPGIKVHIIGGIEDAAADQAPGEPGQK